VFRYLLARRGARVVKFAPTSETNLPAHALRSAWKEALVSLSVVCVRRIHGAHTAGVGTWSTDTSL